MAKNRHNLVGWVEFTFFVIFRGASAFNVTIISLLPYSIDVGVNLRWTGSALKAAVEDTNLLFEPRYHAVLKLIYNETHQSCVNSTVAIPRMLAEYYYGQKLEGSCVALVGAPKFLDCTDMDGVANLAREWDVMAFAMGPVSEEVVKNDLAFLMGGSSLGMAAATWSVMEHYAWLHATILLDENSFTNYYSQYAKSLQRARKNKHVSGISLSIISMKRITEAILTESLKAAQNQSRVLIISAPAATALRILRIASQLNMTNGNYAFINFQTTLQEPYGKLSYFKDPPEKDLSAIQSLIFMASRQTEINSRRNRPLNQRLKELSKKLYNTTYDEDFEPLDAIVVHATYDSIDFFMRQLNTSSLDNNGKCSGREMSSKATNRTFALRTGTSFIDEDGVRELDTAVYRFSVSRKAMRIIGFYDSSSRILLWDPNITTDWPNGITPVDMPPCGFRGLSEACSLSDHSWKDDLKVALPVVATFAVSLLITVVWYRHSHFHGEHDERRWILDSHHLKFHGVDTSSVGTVFTVSLINLMKKEFNLT